MKLSLEKRNEIVDLMVRMVSAHPHKGYIPAPARREGTTWKTTAAWRLWFAISANVTHDDDLLAKAGLVRVFPRKDLFDLYPENIDNASMTKALKWCLDEAMKKMKV